MLDISECFFTKKTEFLDQWDCKKSSFNETPQSQPVPSSEPSNCLLVKNFFLKKKVSLFLRTSTVVFFFKQNSLFQQFFFFSDQTKNFVFFKFFSLFSKKSLPSGTLNFVKNASFIFSRSFSVSCFKIEKNLKKRKLLQNFFNFFQSSDLFFQKIFFYAFSFYKKKMSPLFPLTFFLLFFENISKKSLNFFSFEKKFLANFQETLYFPKIQFKVLLVYRSFVSFFASFFFEKFFSEIEHCAQPMKDKIPQCFSLLPFYIANFSLKQAISSAYFFSCASLASLFYKPNDFTFPEQFFSVSTFPQSMQGKQKLLNFFFLFQRFSWSSTLERILFEFSSRKKVFFQPWLQKNFLPLFCKSSLSFLCSDKNVSFFSKRKEVMKKLEFLFKKFWNPDFSSFSFEKESVQNFFSLSAPSDFQFPLLFFPTNLNCVKKHFFFFSNFLHCLKFQNCFWRVSEKFLLFWTSFLNEKNFLLGPLFSCFFVYHSSFSFYSVPVFAKNLSSQVKLSLFNEYESEKICYTFPFFLEKKLKRFVFCDKQPTLENLKNHLNKCKNIISSSLGKDQFFLMKRLKNEIFHWTNLYSEVFPKRIFFYCDFLLFQYLWKWARKTHPKKNKSWIRQKYFFCINSKIWFFGFKKGNKRICLPLHSQIRQN